MGVTNATAKVDHDQLHISDKCRDDILASDVMAALVLWYALDTNDDGLLARRVI